MAQLLLIKVKEGLSQLRNPLDNMLLVPGQVYEMPASQFWLRRLKQGDVVIAEPAQSEPKEKKVKAKKGE